ncbi:MAG: hypothetical protein E7473_02405 [Ruminococcaceae bacterium]|nr:hypothetical protein [Oscillospiraceae bacterium]
MFHERRPHMTRTRKKARSLINISQKAFVLLLMLTIATLCIASSLSYENTFIVYKGENVTVFNSNSSDISVAFAESGISVGTNEYVVMSDSLDDGTAKIYIFPKKKITVKTPESEHVIYTEKDISVSDFLTENNITYSDKELLLTPADDFVFDGLTIEIIAKKMITVKTPQGEHVIYTEKDISVSDFLTENNITYSDKETLLTPSDDLISDGLIIEIVPKNKICLKDANEETLLYIESGVLVSELLSANNITLSEHDLISVPVTDTISKDMEIVITRVSYKTIEETKEIPYSTEKRENKEMKKGTTKIIQNGKNGSKKLSYKITITNGIESKRELIGENIITQPTNEIVEYGTKVPDSSGVVKTKSGSLEYKKVITMTATAYTTEGKRNKTTATGAVAKVGLVAVDKSVIPLGSKLYIEAADGKSWCYGIAVAADTGVRGNKIDLFFNTKRECLNFGVRKAKVYILK